MNWYLFLSGWFFANTFRNLFGGQFKTRGQQCVAVLLGVVVATVCLALGLR